MRDTDEEEDGVGQVLGLHEWSMNDEKRKNKKKGMRKAIESA